MYTCILFFPRLQPRAGHLPLERPCPSKPTTKPTTTTTLQPP